MCNHAHHPLPLNKRISPLCFFAYNHVIKNKRKGKVQKADTCQNQKMHMPPMSLLLWHEMVVMRCFIWPLALRLWSGW